MRYSYRLVPSVSSVSKRKDGTYSVASVSCTRTKSVGGTTSITTDGVLKYSKDGGAEVEIQNGTAISPEELHGAVAICLLCGWAGRGPGNYTHGCGRYRR